VKIEFANSADYKLHANRLGRWLDGFWVEVGRQDNPHMVTRVEGWLRVDLEGSIVLSTDDTETAHIVDRDAVRWIVVP